MSTVGSNIKAALLVHITTLSNSFLAGLILPKFLAVAGFGYWQYFGFFAGCLELLLLGIGTGFYLCYGGFPYEKIDKSLIKYVLIKWLYAALGISIILAWSIMLVTDDTNKRFVFSMLIIGMFVINIGTFFSYILQATNRIKAFLCALLVQNIILILSFSFMMYLNVGDYKCYIYGFMGAHIVRGIVLLIFNKEIVFARANKGEVCIWSIVLPGIHLMFADYAIYLTFGIGRLFIENEWGIEVFSKFSFAMSLILLMVTFINQIGLVLFPVLKKFRYDKIKEVISGYGKRLDIVLIMVFFLYFLARKLLLLWLPQYNDAIFYFGLLIPVCVFDGRNVMLINPVLKAIRAEKTILYINISFLLISVFLFMTLWHLNKPVTYFCCLFAISSICRSFIGEWCMSKLLNIRADYVSFLGKLLISGIFYMGLLEMG